MSGITLALENGSGLLHGLSDSESGGTAAVAQTEHEECGNSSFYPLSPVHMSLYYSFVPEFNID
jgi:hypothetical protein